MRKILLTLAAFAMFTVSANAKKGDWYGSEEGGFAITFNANPVLNYIGNMFNGTSGNSLEDFDGIDGKNLFSGNTITGKYFMRENLALDLGFGFNNKYKVKNNYDDSDDLEEVTAFSRATTTAFHVKAGLEYRLKAGDRLQPLFGADIVFQHTNKWNYSEVTEGTQKDSYTYSGSPTNALGLILNAGVEYFIIPQIALGANLSFGLAKKWTHSSNDYETNNNSKEYSRIDSKDTFLQTGNVGANVTLNFYF